MKEVLELKNKRNFLENSKPFAKAHNFKDSFDRTSNNSKNISLKKQLVSDLSSSSSDFSGFFERKNDKTQENPAKHSKYSSNSFIKHNKNNSKDLPRDKESFNKRKSMNIIAENAGFSSKNNNLLSLFEKNCYFLPQSRRKDPSPSETRDELLKIKNLDLTNTIISIKNSMDYLKNPEKELNFYVNSLHLRRKSRENHESHDKSREKDKKPGKIVNQAAKLKPSHDTSAETQGNNRSCLDFFENPLQKRKKSAKKLYIDEKKPAALRNDHGKPANSLVEKLKKEILLINEQEFGKKTYVLRENGGNHEKIKEKSNEKARGDSKKEQRSVSLRRTMNCLLETLSSEDEENSRVYKKHAQRKSLNPGSFVGNAKEMADKTRNFEKKDIEKIYKEFKSKKI